ncbi:M23 family metallopeptidase [Candidatus Woesebacteria bacterium]|nr:M23 family metallopeptidase [Candidatus Woesebacteria bacterium]
MVEGQRIHHSHNLLGDGKDARFSDSQAQRSPQIAPNISPSRKRYLQIIAPICIAIGQFAAPARSETNAHEQTCTLLDGTGIKVEAHRDGQTCIEVVQLPQGRNISIIEKHGKTRSDHSVVMVESDSAGHIYKRAYSNLDYPDYKLPPRLQFTTSKDVDMDCLQDGPSSYTCSVEAPTAAEPPIPAPNKPLTNPPLSAVRSVSERTDMNTDECLSTWGTKIVKGVEEDGYTCTWKGTNFGIEYTNFAHESNPTFVIYNPQNGYFSWDYGQIDQTTFAVKLGPVPQNPELRVSNQSSSKPEKISIFDRLKLLVASIMSTENKKVSPADVQQVPVAKKPERCVQNPINNMSLTQQYGHTAFAKGLPEIYGDSAFHNGIDLNSQGGSLGQPVRHALCFGTVTEVEDTPNQCGSCSVRVSTEVDGIPYTFLYFHLACPTAINIGDTVNASTQLGTIWPDSDDAAILGDTGEPYGWPHDYCSTGPHLHLGLYNSLDQNLDPLSILPFEPAPGSGNSPQ